MTVPQAAISESGAIVPLVSLLEGNDDPEAQQARIGPSTASRPVLAASPLVGCQLLLWWWLSLLLSFLLLLQQAAAGALCALAENKVNRVAITTANGIAPLVGLLACTRPVGQTHDSRLSLDSH
mgnify:CR=1 FL=1